MRPFRDLLRHTLIYGMGSLVTSLISFFLIPLYTRYLTPGEYGILGLFLLLHALLTRFYDLGLTNSIGRYFFEYRSDTSGRKLSAMVTTTLVFLLAYGGILTTVLFVLAPQVADVLVGHPHMTGPVRIVGATLLLEALAIPSLTLLRMEERSTLWVSITVLRVTVAVALNVYFVVFARRGVQGILLSNALTAGAVLVLTIIPLLRRMRLRFEPAILSEMLRFGLPFFPTLLAVWIVDSSDRYLLELLRTTEEVGLYTLGCRFAQVMMVVVSAFSMGWAPLRYRIYERPDARELYRRIATLFVAGSALVVVGLSVFADEIVRLAATPPYFPASRVIPLIAASYALYGLHLVTVTGMGVAKKTTGLTLVSVVAALLNVGANVLAIPRFGMMGAAATTVAAYAVLVYGTFVLSQRHYPIAFEWGRMTGVAMSALAIIVLDRWSASGNLVVDALKGTSFLALFLLALVGVGALRAADGRAVAGWFREIVLRPQTRPLPPPTT